MRQQMLTFLWYKMILQSKQPYLISWKVMMVNRHHNHKNNKWQQREITKKDFVILDIEFMPGDKKYSMLLYTKCDHHLITKNGKCVGGIRYRCRDNKCRAFVIFDENYVLEQLRNTGTLSLVANESNVLKRRHSIHNSFYHWSWRLYKQMCLLANESVSMSLPDRGEKIKKLLHKIIEELDRRPRAFMLDNPNALANVGKSTEDIECILNKKKADAINELMRQNAMAV